MNAQNRKELTMKTLLIFASVSVMLSGCMTTTLNTETTKAICESWEYSLFLPSRSDTIETARGLTDQKIIHNAACK